jgi:hypothetical protein
MLMRAALFKSAGCASSPTRASRCIVIGLATLERRNFAVACEFAAATDHAAVEASALQHPAGIAGMHGRSPLLRLQSDERLIALVRRGNNHSF